MNLSLSPLGLVALLLFIMWALGARYAGGANFVDALWTVFWVVVIVEVVRWIFGRFPRG